MSTKRTASPATATTTRASSAPSIAAYDTTLRDGAQCPGITFSVEDKIKVARTLDGFGVTYIEGGWPGSNPKDSEFFKVAQEHLHLKNATLTAFGATCRPRTRVDADANLQALVAAGVRIACIFGKAWDLHVTCALGTTLDENLRMIRESVAFLRSRGLQVIYDAEHYFDGLRANQDYALATIEEAARAGASCIVLCDTNGGSLPALVADGTRAAAARLGAAPATATATAGVAATSGAIASPGPVSIGIHAHNDSGLAVANTLAAVEAGATHVQGTFNGYGERCGNADLTTVIPLLQLKMGLRVVPEGSLPRLYRVARVIDEIANVRHHPTRPFVGSYAFTHKGGVHVSALLKNPETYEHVRPDAVGNRRRVTISELGGRGNALMKASEYGLSFASAVNANGEEALNERSVVEIVKDLEHQGYAFEGAEASFELLLRRALGQVERAFELGGFRLIVEKRDASAAPTAEATLKLRVRNEVVHSVAEGDGPVNALDNALRKALSEAYPELADIRLTDYRVRVVDESSGTAASVRVLIESTDGRSTWGTVGVSTNIIEASWQALVDSIEYGLMLSGRRAADGGQRRGGPD